MSKDLKKMTKAELFKKVEYQNELLEGLRPEIEIADYEKLSWLRLPVILQDLGFKVKEQKGTETSPPIDIYYKQGVACFKNSENLWVVAKGDYKMAFKMVTKFHAFQLFSMLGVTFSDEDSTAHGLDQPIDEFLTKAKMAEITSGESK